MCSVDPITCQLEPVHGGDRFDTKHLVMSLILHQYLLVKASYRSPLTLLLIPHTQYSINFMYCKCRNFCTRKILYSGVREVSYAVNFLTARVASHALHVAYVHGFVCY